MIASTIGKIFLDAYNERYQSKYSAKEFFVEKFYDIFFNHNKYMMSAGNSPLENPKISWDKMRTGQIPYETVERRNERFIKTVEKIEIGPADASIAIGFPTLDLNATTSGQVTNLNLPINTDDIYLSWIGGGLGIGVHSGLSLLFSNKQILLDLFDGWQYYRDFLNKTPALRGNQINTWNGQWLAHRYDKYAYDASSPTASFNPFGTMKDGGMEVNTQAWTKVLLSIARTYSDTTLTAYIYSLGQTNTTIGFIPFDLTEIKRPFDLWRKCFATEAPETVVNLFGTAIGFTEICKQGSVGIYAMEPSVFSEYFNTEKKYGEIPTYNYENEINFNTYLIWLLAMLNNEQLWDKSLEFAQQLINYVAGSEKARANRNTAVEELLKSTKKEKFLENLIQIMKEPDSEKCEEIGKEVHFMSSATEFPYFATLLRFQYARLNKLKQ
jgi:hypothetical protein